MLNHVSCQGSDSDVRVLPIPIQVSRQGGSEGPAGQAHFLQQPVCSASRLC